MRIPKILITHYRNMRRRRKPGRMPSSLPFVLLFVTLLALCGKWSSSNKDLVSLARVENAANATRVDTPASTDASEARHAPMNEHDAPSRESTHQEHEGRHKKYMERRRMERRGIHRRIEERKHSGHGSELAEGHTIEKADEQTGEHGSESTDQSKSSSEEAGTHLETAATVVDDGGPQEAAETGAGEREADTKHEDGKQGGNKEAHENESVGSGEDEQAQNVTEGIPAGARTSGKVAEFRGSLGGTSDGMLRGQNVTRVSYTLFKIMKLFGFSSLVDSPAGAHAEWMGDVVRRMAFDQPSFRYWGVDDGSGVRRARTEVGESFDAEFVEGDVEMTTARGADVVFHWTELDGGGWDPRGQDYHKHVRKVVLAAKKADNGYIVLGQFPRLNGPSPVYRKGKWMFEGDEREEPFLMNGHVRGVVPMGSGREAYMLYMTFYSLRGIPEAELEL